MKAVALSRYGGPEVLAEVELPTPKIGPDGVLVRTRAVGVNPVDWKIREGYLDGALPSHFPLVPGWDVAGVVAAVGPAVSGYQVGDEVLGYVRRDDIQHGTYAELVPAPERTLAHKPVEVDWAAAGGLPLAGLTAYQTLTAVRVSEGDTVLVHAAAGGVGHLAVQLARILGARRVIGTASPANHDFLRGLGAEPVTYGPGLIDRIRGLGARVDAVVDYVGGAALEESASLVEDPTRIASIVDGKAMAALGGRYVFVRPDTAQLSLLVGYVRDGRLTVHIAQRFPLAEAAAAQRLIEGGHVRGKVVLEVA